MLLAIDTGNTNTVFALYKGREKLCDWRCKTVPGRTSDEYASWLDPLFKLQNVSFTGIEDVIISSVVPDANFDLRRLATKYLGCEAKIVGKDIKDIGLEIALDRPDELGADRIVNSVAAINKYDLPGIIIDFGTATTFDIINEQGVYSGGAISPGVNLSMDALHKAAAQLPRMSISKPSSSVGTSTISALQSGLFFGYASMIEGMLKRLSSDMGFKTVPNVIATGGLARLFASSLPEIKIIDENLTLDGLAIIHEQQVRKRRHKHNG